MNSNLIDVLAGANRRVEVLTEGFVGLSDVLPRLVPIDRTVEVAIVEAARVSTGQGLREPSVDAALIRYLFRNHHTSPFEQVEFKFVIRCPLFVKNQIIRHRTFSYNEFSQRYAEVKDIDGDSFFHPSKMEEGIRSQDSVNKQGSSSVPNTAGQATSSLSTLDQRIALKLRVEEAEKHLEKGVEIYQDLISRSMSRETARFCLSNSTWTTFYMKGSLHNFLHFLELRLDNHAQLETRRYAEAIYSLIKPLIPVTAKAFEEFRFRAITFSAAEVEALKNKTELQGTATEKAEFEAKKRQIGF